MSQKDSWLAAPTSSRFEPSTPSPGVPRLSRCRTCSSSLSGTLSLRVPMTKRRSCVGVITTQTAVSASPSSARACVKRGRPHQSRITKPMRLKRTRPRLKMARRRPATVRRRTNLKGLRTWTMTGRGLSNSSLQVPKRQTKTAPHGASTASRPLIT